MYKANKVNKVNKVTILKVVSSNPLWTKECQTSGSENDDLMLSWVNCTSSDNRIREDNKHWKEYSKDEKTSAINDICCKEVLQCSNPNEWLMSKGINVTCDVKIPDQPNFGSRVVSQKIKNTRMYGVY